MMLLAVVVLICAAGPAAMFIANLRLYCVPDQAVTPVPAISVLIPARNEEQGIAAAMHAALQSEGVAFEVVVLDDCSTDNTAALVAALAERDPRVRLERSSELPAGWNGKQHACWMLAHRAKHGLLCFVDADVQLAPDALARMAAFLVQGENGLVSGFPRQITETWMEWMLLPLIHFVLLGFLPLQRMRSGTDPAFAASCGQFMLVNRQAYFAAGGHAGIRQTMHDGLLLPQLLRRGGYRTDLADMTGLASCRMYTNAGEVWRGLSKNATEGLAAPARILPVTLLLVLGQVMPFALVFWLWWTRSGAGLVGIAAALALIAAWLPRALAIRRFRQDWRGALLHPIGIALLLTLQWCALVAKLRGKSVTWKDRPYATP